MRHPRSVLVSHLLLLLFAVPPSSSGHVVSRLAARPRPADAPSHERLDGAAGSAVDVPEFSVALSRLQGSPSAPEALGALLEYLERIRDHPRDSGARSVCVWEPTFRTHLATVDGGLQAMRAAGFEAMEKDSRGTPFLVMRHAVPSHTLTQLIDATAAALTEVRSAAASAPVVRAGELAARAASVGSGGGGGASALAGSEGGDLAARVRLDATAGDGDTDGDDGAAEGGDVAEDGVDGDGEDDVGSGGESAERVLVQQISSMISGLIAEFERQTSGGGAGDGNATAADGAGAANGTDGSRTPSPPIHFRVYRSPNFPGLPPGGGLPFLPGGLGGGVGGDGDEDGEVPMLERRLRAANLPVEAEEVCAQPEASHTYEPYTRFAAAGAPQPRPAARTGPAPHPGHTRATPGCPRPHRSQVVTRELRRLRRMSPMHSEYSTLVDYLEWIADLPWNNSSEARLTIRSARAQVAPTPCPEGYPV